MESIPWRRGQASVVGQLVEWDVWVELVVRSEGRLHVFLPMLDRGIDALVHRLDDELWIPVQVKGQDDRSRQATSPGHRRHRHEELPAEPDHFDCGRRVGS
jgi:hypothetical protein